MGGDLFSLVEKMEGVSFIEAVKWLSSFFAIDIEGLDIKERKSQLKKELSSFIKAMNSRKKIEISEYTINADIKQIVKFRNFQKETIDHFHMGFVEKIDLLKRNKDTYTLFNRLLFPIYYKDEIVGMALRRTKHSDVPKWSNQPVDIDTSRLLYNYDGIKDAQSIVVVEGITDVWAYYEIEVPAVATFGSHLTKDQYRLLMMTGADVVFSYDGDDAGRGATKKAIEMLKNKANIYVVDIPDGSDPESIDREELLKLYESRTKR